MVDTAESGQHLGTIQCAVKRAFWPFEYTNGMIAIDRHKQDVTQLAGAVKP